MTQLTAAADIAPPYRIPRYPSHLIERVTLADGRAVTVRPVQPQDAELQQALVRALSPASRYRRFHGALGELSPAMLRYLTDIDYDDHLALMATVIGPDGRDMQIAEARYVRRTGQARVADIAIAVADRWQGIGLGTHLLRRLASSAAAGGIRSLQADVLSDNRRMLDLLRRLGWRLRSDRHEPRSMIAEIELQADSAQPALA